YLLHSRFQSCYQPFPGDSLRVVSSRPEFFNSPVLFEFGQIKGSRRPVFLTTFEVIPKIATLVIKIIRVQLDSSRFRSMVSPPEEVQAYSLLITEREHRLRIVLLTLHVPDSLLFQTNPE